MGVLWIVVIALGVITAVLAIGGLRTMGKGNDAGMGLLGAGALVGLVFLTLGLVAGWKQAMPEYRLWQASVEKRILVEQARAEADAASEQARAEVARAKGTAESNRIVADSINEEYLRYLYINSISHTENQIIYVPTEAGLPILEAGKR